MLLFPIYLHKEIHEHINHWYMLPGYLINVCIIYRYVHVHIHMYHVHIHVCTTRNTLHSYINFCMSCVHVCTHMTCHVSTLCTDTGSTSTRVIKLSCTSVLCTILLYKSNYSVYPVLLLEGTRVNFNLFLFCYC